MPSPNRLLVRNFAYALSFDGSSRVNLPYVNFGTSAITIAGWFYAGSSSDKNYVSFMTTLIRINPASGIITWFPNTWGASVNAVTPISVGRWYHIAITQSSTSYAIYLNGASVGSGSCIAISSTDTSNRLGSYPAGNDWFGSISQVNVWSIALDSNQVSALYFSGVTPSAVQSQYLLETGSGTSAIDTSGNGNNSTSWTGSPTWTTNTPMVLRTSA